MSSNILICLFTLISCAASAQKTNIWQGGTPGHQTEWAYFKNWSTGCVPNEFDRVVIPDVSASTGHYPVIHTGEIEISALELHSGASLMLLPGARLWADELLILGTCKACAQRTLIEEPADVAVNSTKK